MIRCDPMVMVVCRKGCGGIRLSTESGFPRILSFLFSFRRVPGGLLSAPINSSDGFQSPAKPVNFFLAIIVM